MHVCLMAKVVGLYEGLLGHVHEPHRDAHIYIQLFKRGGADMGNPMDMNACTDPHLAKIWDRMRGGLGRPQRAS